MTLEAGVGSVAGLVEAGEALRTLHHSHLEGEEDSVRVTDLADVTPGLTQLAGLHVMEALPDNSSQHRHQFACFSPAEILDGEHLNVRDERALHPAVEVLGQATVGDVPRQFGELGPAPSHLLHLLNPPQQAGVEVVDIKDRLLGHGGEDLQGEVGHGILLEVPVLNNPAMRSQ